MQAKRALSQKGVRRRWRPVDPAAVVAVGGTLLPVIVTSRRGADQTSPADAGVPSLDTESHAGRM
ncbi:hypothetical protein GCM10025760_39010 [Microbacterium yannicii]|uniref:Uncharacterized protein n=1 Tax=Microbacterium yannicii TaxID=671622 RepID=A0ABP9MXS0_9MICO